ncbi:two-component regulator propeller domain-containing protein [Pedobacter gandavensis]|uniref:hybrid sensor histidine kinase/response regulator transcription factor n=1 Tax=Pedobacter gandavensis TaxID=2679963 RepID=UPI0024798A03|nr:two-component regulator propeller domain-containing protein [Pedobacter gandavensis]WGQ10118.1 two-component regulator propeller domain-containing protein [Pedobacter gandavensis]
MFPGRTLVFLLFLLICSEVSAQPGQIQFSRMDLSDGLSHNQVNAVLKDSKGFIWFATLSGLNRYDGQVIKVFKHNPRDTSSIIDDFITNIYELPGHKLYLETRSGPNIYDPETESFIRNTTSWFKSIGIDSKGIREVLKDKAGDFWFNAQEQGIYKYEVSSASTKHLKLKKNNEKSLSDSPVSGIQSDPAGAIWIIHRDKTMERLDRKTAELKQRILTFKTSNPSEMQDFKLFADEDGDLWMYTLNNQRGITYFNPKTGQHRQIDKAPGALNSNLISGMLQDPHGQIWIGTDHGGVNVLNKKTFKLSYLLHKEDDPKSIGQNSITCLYKDISGIIWVGTFKKGLSFYHEKILKFPLFRHQGASPDGLVYDDVNRFAEDDQGNLWIGTNGGGLFYFNRKTKQFKRYQHQHNNPNSLSNDIIVSLFVDKGKRLWIGTYFGGLDSFDGKTFKHYRHEPGNPTSLSDDRVWDILEDRSGNLWVATLSGGLNLLDRSTGKFSHFRAGAKNGIHSDFLSCLIEDKKGNLWIGSSDGIDQLKPDGSFVHHKHEDNNVNSLINNIVYDLMEDSYGFIWAATRDGLSRLDPARKAFRNFDTKDGLGEKATLKIVEDNQRNLWVSTANGLFNVVVKPLAKRDFSYTFHKYDEHDGLQGSAFNANAGYKTSTGDLAFGGANGFNLFQPERIKNDLSKPVIVFTDLQVENKSVGIGEPVNGRILLEKSLSFTDGITLKHNQNGFAIEFAALNYFNPHKIRYRYKLEGFDEHWQEPQPNSRRATYTNIDPGAYTFKVMSTDASGNWVNNEADLKIIIQPPFWSTWMAYLLYALAIGGGLLWIRHRGIARLNKEFLLKQERQQASRMHELDLMKIKFLTNVSHEFRTPLSLIITPLEKLIGQNVIPKKQELQLMHRNGKRLLNLVNQLLDFRKMEVRELRLHPKPGEAISFIRELCLSFNDLAEQRRINFSFHTEAQTLMVAFDHDKVERIVFNLLSNAFKFTPEGGKIWVTLEIVQQQISHTTLLLKVSDTGIGMEADKTARIFERFFQNDMPDSIVNQGTGIGLSITKEFVKLHDGKIHVNSVLNEGSEFCVSLDLANSHSAADAGKTEAGVEKQELVDEGAALMNTSEDPKENFTWKSKKQILMLVEDNEDFRFYLKDNLSEFYQIVEASNGKEGWQKILSSHPDLIVSDVTMPEMNGTELCKKIKSDKRTAHLPVILLTAVSNEDQQLLGLETGANDYMTKPFNFEILLSKIRNILKQQALAKKTYQKQVEFKPAESEVESLDDKFMRQLGLHLEKNLSNSAYSVDQLGSDLNMSRVGLYKKILPLTGKSPIEYIRSYRLHKSKALLLKSQLSIAEIAYEVGFSNPKHFSRYFKQEFDILPSAYANQKIGETSF